MGAVVHHVLVDLVGHRDAPVAHAEVADRLEFRPAQHPSRRVGRRVDDDGAGAGAEGRGQPVEVQRAARLEGDEHRARVGEDGVRAVVLVERLEDHHLLARVHQREQRGDHRLGGAAGDGDLAVRIHRHAVPEPVLVGQRLAQPLRPPGDGVLVDVGFDGPHRGPLEQLRRREVGEALRQVDGVVLPGEPGHAADHGFAEAGGAAGHAHAPMYTRSARRAVARVH